MLLLLLAILGVEPVLRPVIYAGVYLPKNLKLLMDTRAQVALQVARRHEQRILEDKQKILQVLDRVAIRLSPQDKRQLAQLIYKESREQNVDPRLIIAMIKTESGFRNEALSRAGARGLMQVRFHTAKEIARETGMQLQGRKNLHEPHLNIKMGTYYLVKMLQRFENLELALTAYNMGPTALRKRMRAKNNIPQRYSRRVLKIYRQL